MAFRIQDRARVRNEVEHIAKAEKEKAKAMGRFCVSLAGIVSEKTEEGEHLLDKLLPLGIVSIASSALAYPKLWALTFLFLFWSSKKEKKNQVK